MKCTEKNLFEIFFYGFAWKRAIIMQFRFRDYEWRIVGRRGVHQQWSGTIRYDGGGGLFPLGMDLGSRAPNPKGLTCTLNSFSIVRNCKRC